VGAWMTTPFPEATAGQPSSWAGVGASNVRSNHSRTAGLKGASALTIPAYRGQDGLRARAGRPPLDWGRAHPTSRFERRVERRAGGARIESKAAWNRDGSSPEQTRGSAQPPCEDEARGDDSRGSQRDHSSDLPAGRGADHRAARSTRGARRTPRRGPGRPGRGRPRLQTTCGRRAGRGRGDAPRGRNPGQTRLLVRLFRWP
jgi:hypothetical protein